MIALKVDIRVVRIKGEKLECLDSIELTHVVESRKNGVLSHVVQDTPDHSGKDYPLKSKPKRHTINQSASVGK